MMFFLYLEQKQLTKSVIKSPLFVTVLGSGSAATANVYEVSEPRAESWENM